MPASQFFAVLFFLMLLCLGVDSQFAMVETILTAINDAHILPDLNKPAKSALVCFTMMLIGLLFVTRAGLHWLELFDSFAVNVTLFVVGMLECVAIGWVYGGERFAADAMQMTSKRLPRLLLLDIKYLVPCLLMLLSIETLVASLAAGYHFPPAAIAVGWMLSLCSLIPLCYCVARRTDWPVVCATLAHEARSCCSAVAAWRRLKGRRRAPPPRLPKEVTLQGGEGAADILSEREEEAATRSASVARPASPAAPQIVVGTPPRAPSPPEAEAEAV
jgi:hypothetical protein